MQWDNLLDFSVRILGAYIMLGGICGMYIFLKMYLDPLCFPRFIIRTPLQGILLATTIIVYWPILFVIRNRK